MAWPLGRPVYLTVAKADARLSVRLPVAWKTKRPVAAIRVHADGTAANGRVQVSIAGKTVTAAARDGVAKVRLPKASNGRKAVTIFYAGDCDHAIAKASGPSGSRETRGLSPATGADPARPATSEPGRRPEG